MRDIDFRDTQADDSRRPDDSEALGRAWRALVQALVEYLGNRFHSARPWLERMQAGLHDAESVVLERGRGAAESARQTLRDKPFLGVLLAAGAAFLASRMNRH